MKPVRLLSVGEIGSPSAKVESSDHAHIDRDAMLVYAGTFESMDGPVEITDDHIQLIHKSFSDRTIHFSAQTPENLKEFPPVQLDHSTSATMTVGRLIGPLSIGDYEGKKALFGKLRILGRENVEKASDGRWTHLSIGADLETGKLNELTITPFPAAPNAAMLARLKMKKETVKEAKFYGVDYSIESCTADKGGEQEYFVVKGLDGLDAEFGSAIEAQAAAERLIKRIHVYGKGIKMSSGETKGYVVQIFQNNEGQWTFDILGAREEILYSPVAVYMSEDEAKKAAESRVRDMPALNKPEKQLSSEGDNMDKEKLKKYLMEHHNLSEKDADEKLAKADDDEMKRMSAEHDEHEKKLASEESEKKNADMTAKRDEFTKLSASFKSSSASVRLAEKKIKLSARLSKLRASAKISPAEIKSIDVAKLAAKSDEALESFFEGFDKREAVVMVGVHGNARAVELSEVKRLQEKKEIEKETLSNMPFTAASLKGSKSGVRLSGAEDLPNHSVGGEGGGVAVESDDSPAHSMLSTHMAHLEMAYAKMDEGKHDEAKEHLKHAMSKLKEHMGRPAEEVPPHDDKGAEERLSSLSESVKLMGEQFDQMVALVSPVLGIEK